MGKSAKIMRTDVRINVMQFTDEGEIEMCSFKRIENDSAAPARLYIMCKITQAISGVVLVASHIYSQRSYAIAAFNIELYRQNIAHTVLFIS